MPIRLIHFSDLHLSLIDDENVINLVHEMTQTLLKLSVQHSIDLIIFTGDMIDRGGKNFQTISEAFECFKKIVMDPICEKLSIPSTHFIIIPGNHDTKTTQKELNDKKIYLMNNAINSYNDVIKMKNTQEAYYKDSWVSRTKAFKDFERKVYKCSTKEFNSTDFESNWIIKSN
ncbi:metallophosphoesterase family protein, partial [Bacteroides fragilis]